ncbi:MAG: serine/threonine-protein phosphatase [Bryobacterales bacterium]|nr:serine/threonine-protein phosphatase [Bryobacterales bacterium]
MLLPHDFEDTIELQQKLARVQSLLEASRRVHGTIRLDEVLHGVLEIAVKELEADGAFFAPSEFLRAARETTYGRVPRDWAEWQAGDEHKGFASARLASERGDSLTHLVVCRAQPLGLEEADFLEGLALQAALAVGNARHHEQMLEWERVRQDLEAARAIQRSLLPQAVPVLAGYSLGYRATTCYEVGGDYLDILPQRDGRLMMVVADVAGKGSASALVSASFRSMFRAMAEADFPLAEMASRVNQLHWQEGPEARRRYVTAFLMRLDPVHHVLEAVNAGHNPGFLVAPGLAPIQIESSGPPLGLLPNLTYTAQTCGIPPGARIFVYTDGLTEVFRGEEQFGEERLLATLCGLPDSSSAGVLEAIWQAVTEFDEGPRQRDDMTALSILRSA